MVKYAREQARAQGYCLGTSRGIQATVIISLSRVYTRSQENFARDERMKERKDEKKDPGA
jgi:hypothetical protein